MKVVIIYASNSGNTRLAALRIAATLQQKKLPTVIKAVEHAAPADIEEADVCILGSCTWLTRHQEGQLPEHFQRFAEKLQAEGRHYPGKPFAVFALGRKEYTHFCAAADHLVALVRDIEGRLLGDPLRVDGFYQHNEAVIEGWAEALTAPMTAR